MMIFAPDIFLYFTLWNNNKKKIFTIQSFCGDIYCHVTLHFCIGGRKNLREEKRKKTNINNILHQQFWVEKYSYVVCMIFDSFHIYRPARILLRMEKKEKESDRERENEREQHSRKYTQNIHYVCITDKLNIIAQAYILGWILVPLACLFHDNLTVCIYTESGKTLYS